MTVHGLVYEMTQAGSGRVSRRGRRPVTAGDMTAYDLWLPEIDPKIILPGGWITEKGTRRSERREAGGDRREGWPTGNIAARAEVADILGKAGIKFYMWTTYTPESTAGGRTARRIIQDVFEKHHEGSAWIIYV